MRAAGEGWQQFSSADEAKCVFHTLFLLISFFLYTYIHILVNIQCIVYMCMYVSMYTYIYVFMFDLIILCLDAEELASSPGV